MRRISEEKERMHKTRDEKKRIRESKYKLPLKELPKETTVNLFVNVFNHSERQDELNFCLKNNRENKYIDNIIEVNGRPSFNEIFNKCKENEINIIANSDIYFDETLRFVENIGEKECYALTRWEYNRGFIKSFPEFNRGVLPKHSQDVWIFRGKPKKIAEEIYMGIPGCDNKVAHWLSKQYKLINPSKTIRAIHVHRERKRNYNPHNGIKKYRPPFKFVDPC